MNVFVAQVSSLYPIDLAGALYAAVNDPSSQFRLFISEVAELPADEAKRKFVARSAFPLFQWSYDESKIWRQHHIPLEKLSTTEELEAALINVAQNLACDLTIDNEEIFLRAKELAKSASERVNISTSTWRSVWGDFSAGILEEIFLRVVGVQVKVEPYWEIRLGQFENSLYMASNRLALEHLLLHCLNIYPKYLKFIQGGHIEVAASNNSNEWVRYSAMRFDGETIHFSNELNEVAINKNSSFNVRLRGPLEILQLQEFGVMVDLPWYIDAIMQFEGENSSEQVNGIEFVSPMSANTLNRISISAGGKGFRLKPTGYSLLEFNSSKILRVISEKLKAPNLLNRDLVDWRSLINDFPLISQRVSKHQNSVSAFRNQREVESKRNISNGDISALQILDCNFEQINPLMYGCFLLELDALLALMKEWVSPSCPNDAPDEIFNYLKRIKWIDINGEIISSEINSTLEVSVRLTITWLNNHNWNQDIDFSDLKEVLLQIDKSNKRLLNGHLDSTLSGFGLAVKVLRKLIDAYYGFASFCCGALFKAHILYPYLLLGPEDFKAEIQNLLVSRDKEKYILFKPVLWEISDFKEYGIK